MNVNDVLRGRWKVTGRQEDGSITEVQDLVTGKYISGSDFTASPGSAMTVFQFGTNRDVVVHAPADLQIGDEFTNDFLVSSINGSGFPVQVQNQTDNSYFTVGSQDIDPTPPDSPTLRVRVKQSTTEVLD